jgi:hypothetical protein
MEAYVHDAVIDMRMARNELEAALDEIAPGDWGRFVPFGARTLHDLLAHLAAADRGWALAAKGLLKGESDTGVALSPQEAKSAREQAMVRRRQRTPKELREEMEQRRRLLLELYELLEPRHLAVGLRSYGETNNSVRERIWVGYHDRLHAADVRRALRMSWHPQRLTFLPEIVPAIEALSPDPTLYTIYSVDPTRWESASPLPAWSNRQLLMHIATGDWVLQTHLRHILEHGTVAAWPDVPAGNAQRLAERDLSTDRALTEEYLSMRHQTMVLLSELKPQDLELPIMFRWETPPVERTVLDYLLAFERHDRTHREQLRPVMRYATARGGA